MPAGIAHASPVTPGADVKNDKGSGSSANSVTDAENSQHGR
jgi:hypothetical protein